jgi:hypothetical protein
MMKFALQHSVPPNDLHKTWSRSAEVHQTAQLPWSLQSPGPFPMAR